MQFEINDNQSQASFHQNFAIENMSRDYWLPPPPPLPNTSASVRHLFQTGPNTSTLIREFQVFSFVFEKKTIWKCFFIHEMMLINCSVTFCLFLCNKTKFKFQYVKIGLIFAVLNV